MPRILSQAGKTASKRVSRRKSDWPETVRGGPYGRGDSEHLYDCSACSDGDHSLCEKMDMVFCRCWRTKHNDPPNKKGRPRKPKPSNVTKQVEVIDQDDDFDWEEV